TLSPCQHQQSHTFLTPLGCPFSSPEIGSITPIMAGSFMPVGDTAKLVGAWRVLFPSNRRQLPAVDEAHAHCMFLD
ncbi:hypothetical protein, partial [Peristeroidobacter soli]|uniref:hypothetical protein n=1 Tax=Peristeroidobacter soli TaxID=2497877 RepID=UPI001C37C83D